MNKKKILITGVAGFIGFALARSLLKSGSLVYGIDNFDKYYSVELKKKELKFSKNITIFILIK